ncbi:unnamed protein product [Camellia sinensis]
MSVSALFGSRMVVLPNPSSGFGGATKAPVPRVGGGSCGGLVIECSSRPQKKATAHHRKTRPRKTQPWDIRRKPTVYPPLPSLPPEWTLVADDGDAQSLLPQPLETTE